MMNPAFDQIMAADEETRLGLFTTTAQRLGTTPQNVEKDFWVCWTLDALFNGLPDRPRLLFKGGTSLSKGFGLIKRFSEDIDVTVFRDDLGEAASIEELKALSGKKRGKALDDIKAACETYINGPCLAGLSAIVSEAANRNGFNAGQFLVEPDPEDSQALYLRYPTATPVDTYITKAVKIESGAKSALDPNSERAIRPYLEDDVPSEAGRRAQGASRGGLDYTALKTGAIRKLMDAEAIQLTLFDTRNLFECTHPDFPGEKLIVCRNPDLAYRRKHKREALLKATSEALRKIQGMVARGTFKEADKIGVRVGRVINQYKMAKHFKLEIAERQFHFEIDAEKVNTEAELDGIYVIRTSLADALSAEDAVRHYKSLSQVERAFRSIKTMDLEVRPIHHYQEQRVRTHLFLCMLAYYVKWHMMEAWRPLLFADEDQQAKREREPVAPARRSAEAEEKARRKQRPDGSPVHSFQSLLHNLATIVRNTCQSRDAEAGTPSFTIDTQPTRNQRKAFQLLKAIRM